MTIRSRLTPWPTLPLAVGASLGGQACLLYGFAAAGVAFYAMALSLLALIRDERSSNATAPAPDLSRGVLALTARAFSSASHAAAASFGEGGAASELPR